MRKLITSAVLAATAITGTTVAVPATAQTTTLEREQMRRGTYDQQRYDYEQARRDYRRELRNYRQWSRYNYDNPDPRYGNYYADRYYRDGRYYRTRRLSYDDRVYRGYDGRYYCRRSDGTTGLIIGAGAGALAGTALTTGRSEILGVLLGAAVGGALGREVDRGSRRDYYCR